MPLLHLVAVLAQHREGAVACDAAEDGSVQHGGDHRAVDDEDHVHGADLFDILLLRAVQPEHLVVALLLRALACEQAARVVAHALRFARAALGRAGELRLDDELGGLESVLVIAAHGGQDDGEDELLGRMHAEERLGAEHEGTDVKRGAGRGGDPLRLQLDELGERVQHDVDVELRHAQPLRTSVHADEVVAGTEHRDLAIRVLISLQSLKDALTVMERAAGGIDAEVLIGDDLGLGPTALCRVILHDEHMVGEVFAESELGEIGFLFPFFDHCDFHSYLLALSRRIIFLLCLRLVRRPRLVKGSCRSM